MSKQVQIRRGTTAQISAAPPPAEGELIVNTDEDRVIVGDGATTGGVPMAKQSELADAVPAGAMMAYAGSSAPAGWLMCAGQAVSRATYAALYAAISTTYGNGDGSTTFGLPDLRGRVPVGKDNMNGSDAARVTSAGSGIDGDTLGAAGGTETHTLTEAQMPTHSHTDTPSVSQLVTEGTSGAVAGILHSAAANRTANSTLTVSGGNKGSSAAHNNMPPGIILNWIIKT